MRAVMPMIGISSGMSRHSVGAVFWLTNSQHALDPAKNAPSHTAHNSTHEAADRSKYLIPGAGTSTGAITGAWRDTLSLRSRYYGSDRDYTNQKRLHI
jgi:hypothetical protein